jgi:hypothetical protein
VKLNLAHRFTIMNAALNVLPGAGLLAPQGAPTYLT